MRHGKQAPKESSGASTSASNARQIGHFDLKPQITGLLLAADLEIHLAQLIVRKEQGVLDASIAQPLITALCQIKNQLEEGVLNLNDFDGNTEEVLRRRLKERLSELRDGIDPNESANLIKINVHPLQRTDTTVRLLIRDLVLSAFKNLVELRTVLLDLAARDIEVSMPGPARSQKFSPVLLTNWWLAVESRLRRDFQRMRDFYSHMNVLSLGAGQIPDAGTSFDRNLVTRYLGFDSLMENGLDAISDRDYLVEYSCACTFIGNHISQMASELLLWASSEYGFARLPRTFVLRGERYSSNSQPQLLEMIVSRPGHINSRLLQFLGEQKGHTILHPQELSETLNGLFDVAEIIKFVLESTTTLLPLIKFDTVRMTRAASQDTSNASHAIDYLVDRDFALDKAQKIVSTIIEYCKERNKTLPDLTLSEWALFSPAFSDDIYDYISLEGGVSAGVTGAAYEAHKQLLAQQSLEQASRLMQEDRKYLENLRAKRVNLQELLFGNKGI